jgi:FKBP-type peptidyl-prolyl cis-trans isomerase (trigger factor)
MRDEMRSAIARQGVSEEAYLKVTGKTEAEVREELRPQAEKRAKSLLVLSEVAKARGVEIPDRDVDAEVAKARSRYASDRSMVRYFESERGRNYIRSSFRRSRAVEQLVDEWLAAHPEAPRLRHIEEAEESLPLANPSAAASGAIAVSDPASLTPPEAAAPSGA